MLLLGFDVGGTKMEAVILEVGETGQYTVLHPSQGLTKISEKARHRRSTGREKGYEVVSQNLLELTQEVLKQAGVSVADIAAVGMGLPGSVHPVTQKFLTGNTLAFRGRFVAKDLMNRLGFQKPFVSENDGNCLMLAEALMGSGLEHQRLHNSKFTDMTAIGIILGTGVGGGVVAGGQLLRGKQGGGGEVGHTILVSGGHACFCGNEGCAEQYLSGPALEASFMRRRYTKIQEISESRDIFELALHGEPIATAVIQRYKSYLAQFLGNLATIFDPDYFVLGGGISDQDMLYDKLQESISTKLFLKGDDIPVYRSKTGSSGGVFGAALLPLLRSSDL